MSSIIMNADDFGWNKTCSSAIIESFEKKYITTTTACVNGSYFQEAISLIRNTPYCDRVGIHINLTEGEPVTDGIRKNPLFCNEQGEFLFFRDQFRLLSCEDRKNIYDEITAQIDVYKTTGLNLHHADSHHHIHNYPNINKIFLKAMSEKGITKVRKLRNIGRINPVKRIAKNYFNIIMDSKKMSYTDYFGEITDLWDLDESVYKYKTIELMLHPDYDNNILIDRDVLAEYNNPYGETIKNIYDRLKAKNISVADHF